MQERPNARALLLRRVAVGAGILVAVAFAVKVYLDDPDRPARAALEEARALEAQGRGDEAMDAYGRVIVNHPEADDAIARDASAGLLGLLAAGVEEPMEAPRVDEATRLARRYRDLPDRARGGAAATFLADKLGAWADQVGEDDDVARRARLRLLDLAADVALGEQREALAERAATGHRAFADGLADDWPLEALAHYVSAGASGREGAARVVQGLTASLAEDAAPDLSALLDDAETSAATRARITELRDALSAWDGDAERRAVLDAGTLEALQTLQAPADDQQVVAALADAERANGDVSAARARLEAIGPPGRMSTRAQLALASCYLAEERIADADDLLSRSVAARLPAFAEASRAYDVATAGRLDGLLERGERDPGLTRRLARATEAQQQQIVAEWLREQLDRDPEVARLRDRMTALSSVVPTALMLGTIKLRRAHGLTGDAREVLLGQAERLFLAIRNEAEGVPELHLSLGQVYHRLGRAEEGERELGALLQSGDPEVSLRVGHAYRELGLTQRAREVATAVYESTDGALPTTPGQIPPARVRSGAAILMSLLAPTLDEEERWLGRADADDEGVQIRLLEIRARRAYERGDLREAERRFGEVAERYEAQGASEPASVNNAAIAYEEMYLCTGDEAHLDRAVALLERAVTLLPDNALLVSNLAELTSYRGDIAVLADVVQVPVLRLDPTHAAVLVTALTAGPRGEAVQTALAGDRHQRRARELTTQEQVLAPQSVGGWRRELDRLWRSPDVDAMRGLLGRLREVRGLDTSEGAAALERDASEQARARRDARLDAAVEDARQIVSAARRSGSEPTLAAALNLASLTLGARAWERRDGEDAEMSVTLARQGAEAWDGFGPKALVSALLTQGLLEALPDTALARLHESERSRYSPAMLALRAAADDEALRTSLAASALLDEAASLRVTAQHPGVTDRAIARLAQHPELTERTNTVPGDPLVRLDIDITALLAPHDPQLPLYRELLQP